jgi:fluoroquinolone resistance protein
MHKEIIRNSTFRGNDYANRRLPFLEYEKCEFVDCNFAKSDLSEVNFISCKFIGCNLGNAKLEGTGLKGVNFVECKLIGLDFSVCNDFLLDLSFDGCNLDFAYFFKKKLKKTRFANCSICEANFSDSDLSQAAFDNCDLLRTIFQNSQLRGADFRTAKNYSIDPDKNAVKGAHFSYPHVLGLLDKFGIEVS